MQDYVTPFPLLVLVGAHIIWLNAILAVIGSPKPDYPGWRVVGPGGAHWFCLFGGWGFAVLISWVWLFVGSGRADAEFQMRIALLLAVVFSSTAAWTGFYIARLRRTALRWRGDEIVWREGASERRQEFSKVIAMRQSWDSAIHIRFADQSILKLDMYAKNASEFLSHLTGDGRDVMA